MSTSALSAAACFNAFSAFSLSIRRATLSCLRACLPVRATPETRASSSLFFCTKPFLSRSARAFSFRWRFFVLRLLFIVCWHLPIVRGWGGGSARAAGVEFESLGLS